MNWNNLTQRSQLDAILQLSQTTPVLIFKHSTRCSISSMALWRVENNWTFSESELLPYHLDLIAYRDLSNAVADLFKVHHQSPQVLLIKGGKCVLDRSHLDIDVAELSAALGHAA